MLSKKLLQETINVAAKTGADFVEVFYEDTINRRFMIVGGEVENLPYSHTTGVGLRLALKDNYVYGYTDKLNKTSLLKLASDLSASYQDDPKPVTPLGALKSGHQNVPEIRSEEVSNEERKALVLRAYEAERAYSSEIVQASAYIFETDQKVVIAKMDGRYIKDERFNVRFITSAVASDGKSNEEGYCAKGRTMGFEFFRNLVNPEEMGKEAARQAVNNLHASPCPSGEMPVIIENGFGGVIFHESCGHQLEATAVARGASIFSGKFGKQIANKCVTAIDDGTISNEWGSENFDDEGTKQQKRVLIKNGVLTSYMIDELNARKMGMAPTGSSRRESYKYAPTSRMSNTYIAPGKATLDEMLEGIKFGLYAKGFTGGSVNPATGDFNFSVSEGYLIRDGKIAEAVKGAALVGNGADVIMNIDMVGKSLELGTGMCGSVSGYLPVNVGQPAIRVTKITVGGRSNE